MKEYLFKLLNKKIFENIYKQMNHKNGFIVN